ncbi:DUF6090 family protein [Balneola sp. MJW-20]|uniref:DUF6090 family protein n=1 Tax=Gracilimonas aurantiaca TaxID=3234185 RepID=UPI0034673E11
MITLFRRIREKLIASGSLTKYLLYAVGEILLVVIGILIALQVNNWNENRVEKQKLDNYYQRIFEEIKADTPLKKAFLQRNEQVILMNRRTLRLLNSEEPDSLAQLKNTLGALATSWSTVLSYPVLDEFKNSGYLSKVRDPVLKEKFFELSATIEFTDEMDSYIVNQYQNTIEPFVIRSFNYQAVALDRYQPFLVEGGPELNYEVLKDDLELWNIATFKLEIAELYKEYLEDLILEQEEMATLLSRELES